MQELPALLLIDIRIPDIHHIINSLSLHVKYIIIDYYNDTFNILKTKINILNINKITYVGLIKHGHYFKTYKFLEKQYIPSIVYNVCSDDYNLDSWIEIKQFINFLIDEYKISNFDFISCLLYKYPEYKFIFNKLKKDLNINIGASPNIIGNKDYGGSWTYISNMESKSLLDIYFTSNILLYKYVFHTYIVTVKASSYIKYYDTILFNSPTVTYTGFINNDSENCLSGLLNFSGDYTSAINVGNYSIIPYGLTSSIYTIEYQTGYLTILPVNLSISITNYIKIYNGLNNLPNYIINYSDSFDNTVSGIITLSGTCINAINVGIYTIIPYGLYSNNYNFIYIPSILTIIPSRLIISAINITYIYNNIPFYGGEVYYDGFINSDTSFNLLGSLIFSGNSQSAYTPGTYTIIPSGLYNDNYDIKYINGILTILNDVLLIKTIDYSKYYDNLNFTNPTIYYTNTITSLSGIVYFYGSFDNNNNVNTYNISSGGLYSNNYNILYYDGILQITPTELFIQAINYSKLYDAIPFTEISITYIGLLGTDTSNIIYGNLINVGTSYNSINIGTYNIIPYGLYSSNYSIIYSEGILQINPSPLYIIPQLYTKIYDGSLLTPNIKFTISGIYNNENIEIYSWISYFQNQDSGNQLIDISNMTLSGPTINNYYIVPIPAYTGIILPKPLTIIFYGGNKLADGTTGVNNIYYSISGIIGIEQLTISYIATFRSPYSGYEMIDISYVTLYGITSNNYSILPISSIQAYIYQQPLIITWYGGNKIYDANNIGGLLSYTIEGTLSGDILTISNYIATFRNNNVGNQIIDISSIIYYGELEHYILPQYFITSAIIYPSYISINFFGGSKIYNDNYYTSDLSYNIIGLQGNDVITISSYYSLYKKNTTGIQIIDISNVILSGIPINNYIVNPIVSISAIIYPKPLITYFTGGDKIYDGTYYPSTMIPSLSGIISINNIQDNVYIYSFTALYQNCNIGYQYIDISNLTLSGTASSNYVVIIPPYNALINYKPLTIKFYGGTKIYDSYQNAGSMNYSICGIIGNESITISSYIALFRNPNVGIYLIDISNIILSGLTCYNYSILPIIPVSAYITKKSIIANFIGGNKIYDKTLIPGILYYSLSGIVPNGNIYINNYTAVYKNYNVGNIYIDISFITLSGYMPSNYTILPVMPLLSYIYPRPLTLLFNNISKIYDGTTALNSSYTYTISNIIYSDNIILSNYTVAFKTANCGYNYIDVSNIILSGVGSSNYYITPVTNTGDYIYPKSLIAVFSGGNKIYDGTPEITTISYKLLGIVNNDYITISSYYGMFRNSNCGIQTIDISNIILYGLTNNYTITYPINSIQSYIYQKKLYALFSGGHKIYDKTLLTPSSLIGSLSGIVNNESINIVSFSSIYNSYLVGLQYISISNIILSGATLPNYVLQPIPPCYFNIYPRLANINFTGGNKIYDSSLTPGLINIIRTNTISTDYLPVTINNSSYTSSNVGVNTITISNVIINSSDANNYQFTIQQTMSGIISMRNIQAQFSGGNKIYDTTLNVTTTLSYYLINTIASDNVFINNSYLANYRNNNSGIQIIDICNIVLSGLSASNYYINPQLSFNATIYPAPLNVLFTASNKIYDGTTIPYNINYSFSGLYTNDQVYISSYNSSYITKNVGNNRIDFSNIIISGSTSNNYFINNKPSIYTSILQKPLTITFYGGNKTYDGTNTVYNINNTISGIINTEYIYVNNYISTFRNINSGIQIIDISFVSIDGSGSTNYSINPINPITAIINTKTINIIFNNLNKIYDGTSNINYNTISYIIYGLVNNDNISVLSYTGLYKNYNVGSTYLDISNIIITGSSVNNYTIQPIQSLNAYINPRLLKIYFLNGNKIYDGTNSVYNLNYNITNNVSNEYLTISSYTALFRSINVGNQIIDISNIILSGSTINNYYYSNYLTISSYISQLNINISFTGINKIYDNTNKAYVVNPQITGLLQNDINSISISSYISTYANKFVENNKTIYINNIILTGKNSNNYNPLPSISYSNITPLQIYLLASGGTKIYDQTTTALLSYINLSGYFIEDINYISISSYICNYYNPNVENNKLININNIILSGLYAYNYYILSTITYGNILPKLVYTSFLSYDKKFDKSTTANVYNISISGIIYPDNLYIKSYNANYVNPNVGINKLIIINDISFNGYSSSNYYTNVSYAYSNITYPITLQTYYTSQSITYKDSSNCCIISFNPCWSIINIQQTNLLIGINQNIIISNNGIIYNNFNIIFNTNYYFTNISKGTNNLICGLSGLILSSFDNYKTININFLGNYTFNAISNFYNNIGYIVGNNGIIYKTIDNALTWSLINTNIFTNLNDIYIISNNLYIIGNNGLLLTSSDGGATFIPNIISSYNLNSISMYDINNGFIVGNNGTMLKTNDGKTWINIYDISNNNYTNYNLNNIYILNFNDIIIVGDNGIILRSITRGINWILYTSGTILKLSKVYMFSSSNINIIGDQSIILSFNLNPGGTLILYDSSNSIQQYDISSNTTVLKYYFTNFNVNTYYLNNYFYPYQNTLFGDYKSPITQITIKPILYYSNNTTYLLYNTSGYSNIPVIDQSGGIFSINDYNGTLINQQLVTINTLTGQLYFSNNINVNNYSFNIIYTLHNSYNNTIYYLIVKPIIYYPTNACTLLYSISGISCFPYYLQYNGTFSIADYSGNLVRQNKVSINIITGIITFSNLCLVNSYSLVISYTLNNIINTTLYYVTIKPNIYYSVNITNLNYLSNTNSINPYINPIGGTFNIIDMSSNLVPLNLVYISISGNIIFTNSIPVGYYSFIINYIYNNIINSTTYYLNASPYLTYPESYKSIQYNTNFSSIPTYYPTGGNFNISDISGNLVTLNNITIDNTTGIFYITLCPINMYTIMISYMYNNAIIKCYYTIQITPLLNYPITTINILYGTSISSTIPNIIPNNGTFTITEVNNTLVQLKYINFNTNTGILNLLSNIPCGNYNFIITYYINNISSSTTFNIQIKPQLSYISNSLTLYYNSIGYSQKPIYNPLNGLFTISNFIIDTSGIIYFNNNINVGIYTVPIYYFINNMYNTTNYTLIIKPSIYYSISSLILYYDYSNSNINVSVKPYINANLYNGIFSIFDNSCNIINLIPNYVSIDLSGVIYFNPLIKVGIYNFIIYYNLNNLYNHTVYSLIIKPSIYYPIGTIILPYNYSNYISEFPYIDQSGGIFSINNQLIDSSNGRITLLPNINVGNYNLIITYILNNSFNTTNYNIIIQSELFYTISSIIINYGTFMISDSPNYNPLGGIFTISSTIFTINQLGIITFNNNLHVGMYNLIIKYTLNSIINTTYYTCTILPTIYYSIPYTNIIYDASSISVKPTYSELNGYFTLISQYNNINIDISSGILYFNSNINNSNINVGIYNLIIKYTLNYTFNTTNYTLNILPYIYYLDNNNTIVYNTQTTSNYPIYHQTGGLFSINDNIGTLVSNNNITIDSISGLIFFNNNINVGIYSFIITYTLNNLSNTTLYNLTIIPILYYTPSSTNLNYNIIGYSNIPYYNPVNGIFTINSSIVSIDNTGIITFYKTINVGYYEFIITYTLNGTSTSFLYKLYIYPNLVYNINNTNLIYGNSGYSINPVYTQLYGNFYIYDYSNNAVQLNYVNININTGIITFNNNINVGIYTFNIQYILNNVSTYYLYFLNVYPTITYTPNTQSILYNSFNISSKPTLVPIGGTFKLYDISNYTIIQSNTIYNDSSGYLYFSNSIFVGFYTFNIVYSLNGLTSLTSYNIYVYPLLKYNNTVNYLPYGNYYYSDYPLYDQSGGEFSFYDISGSLIYNNIIIYNTVSGTFSFNKFPNVGLYNLNIKYTLNNLSTSINYIFYIIPLLNYNINNVIYSYNTNNYSIQPFAIQNGGYFNINNFSSSTNSINGIYIDISYGIINVRPHTKIDTYYLTIRYTLNSMYGLANFTIQVIPYCKYNINSSQSTYLTFSQSCMPICDPSGGYFTIIPDIYDISSYNTTLLDISNNLISINPVSGIISFSQYLNINIYYLSIIYTINNISINNIYTFKMIPLVIYNPNTIIINYNDISYSIVPTSLPLGGYYYATIPSIDILYSGISINPLTGVLKFNLVNPGTWNINVVYTYNNISTSILYNLTVYSDFFYTPCYLTLPYNTTYITNPPYIKNSNGIFSTQSSISGFSINSLTGIMQFSNINIGIYNISVVYTIYNVSIIINYTLIIQPTITYTPSTMNILYNNYIYSTQPVILPYGGIFNTTTTYFEIDSISGIIHGNASNVGNYIIPINYILNNVSVNTNFIINIYPYFYYPINTMTINYGTIAYSEQPYINPYGGIFSTPTSFIIDISSGIITFNNTLNVGNYNIIVYYSLNNIDISQNYSVIVVPIYYYNTNHIELIYNTGGYKSELPIYNQQFGQFSFISISSIVQIQYTTSYLQTMTNNYGIILNGYSGQLTFGTYINVGIYYLTMTYTLANLSTITTYILTVKPYINYYQNTVLLNYNIAAISSLPVVDQSGGIFNFNNIKDINYQTNKIIINNTTGIINFNTGINVGKYNINIIYTYNNISSITLLTLTIAPIFYYYLPTSTIVVNTIAYSNPPTVVQTGGNFYIVDYNNVNPNNLSINIVTGIMTFNSIDVGTYNFILSYIINNSSITTTYSINVLPYIVYDINTITLNYGTMGYSTFPYILNYGGKFGFYDITSLGIMQSKLSIDISNGKITLLPFINTGSYQISIYYNLKNLQNTTYYNINILPVFYYTISSIILDYNHSPYTSILPFTNPLNGIFYFTDNSNNYSINNIQLNKTSGQLTINKLNIGNYNIKITYYIKQPSLYYNYKVTIIPTFYYSINTLTFNYNSGTVYSCLPYCDPSGGYFNIVYPINNNLLYNLNIDNITGQIIINSNLLINKYSFNICYYNTSITTYNIIVQPLFNYTETEKNIYYTTTGYSSIPNVYPSNGYFTILSPITGITIDKYSGIIYISNILNIGSYTINISYTWTNIPAYYTYTINIINEFQYDISGITILYNTLYKTSNPYINYKNGIFSIDNLYNSIGIFIDSSSGILTCNPTTQVNNYNINIKYLFNNISEYVTFNLLIIPHITYDISRITLNYLDTYISNYPYINPISGTFSTNIGYIDSSGKLFINTMDVGYYTIIINYKINNISNNFNISLLINPIIYYTTSSTNIYTTINYSSKPYVNPLYGQFYLDISNLTIDNTGIITFNPMQSVGKYLLNIYYKLNNIIQITKYYYNIIPYINYPIPTCYLIGGTDGQSCTPDIRPPGGYFKSLYYLDTSGVIYFYSNKVGINKLSINYIVNDLSNNFIYTVIVLPKISYIDGIFNYGINSKSQAPTINYSGGIFNLSFDVHTLIPINLVTIDISSGIIYFNSSIPVNYYYFYINYTINNLSCSYKYNLTIVPIINYSNYNINQYDSFSCYPTIINPTGGTFYSELPSFIELNIDTGKIYIPNAYIVGKYNINIIYTVNTISTTIYFNININPTIYYQSLLINYTSCGYSNSPIVSISGGLFYSFNLPSGLFLNQSTGIFNYNNINVNNYSILVNYLYNDISNTTYFNLIAQPYITYPTTTILNYGTIGYSCNPIYEPIGGIFSISSIYTNILIDSSNGILTFNSTIPVNTYTINVIYIYNNIINTVNTILIITSKTITTHFIAKNKVFDGTNNVIISSNNLVGVINNDIVYIESYNACFQSIEPNIDIPILIDNIVLGGINSNNYNLQYDNLTYGNIYYSYYKPNIIYSNFGLDGESPVPYLSSSFINPLFIISNITISSIYTYEPNTIIVNPFGIISWSNLNIGSYYVTIQVYNSLIIEYIDYTINILTNLYLGNQTITTTLPDSYIDYTFHPLEHIFSTGITYALDESSPGLVSKFSLNVYNNYNNLVHDLGSLQQFTLELDNADPSGNLIIYEYNDDGTVNYDVQYPLTYIKDNIFITHLQYLSDFRIQDLNAVNSQSPIFSPFGGTYYYNIQVSISSLPNSIIYYTIDGSIPSYNSLIYSHPITINASYTTIKAFAVTPGYNDSSIESATYILYNMPCILSGSLIKTPTGYEVIDNLNEGDLIMVESGRSVPIIKIIKYNIDRPNHLSYPICIPKNHFGYFPNRDTYLSQNHAIKIYDNNWIYGIHHLQYFPILKIKPLYYHILLPNYYTDNLIINDMVIESWSGLYTNVIYKNKHIIIYNKQKYTVFNKYLNCNIISD